ncbi:hypothetical protein A4X13_0g8318, partial [Tilletia indica]
FFSFFVPSFLSAITKNVPQTAQGTPIILALSDNQERDFDEGDMERRHFNFFKALHKGIGAVEDIIDSRGETPAHAQDASSFVAIPVAQRRSTTESSLGERTDTPPQRSAANIILAIPDSEQKRDGAELQSREPGLFHMFGKGLHFLEGIIPQSRDLDTDEDGDTQHLDQRAWRHVTGTFGAGGNLFQIGTTAASLFGRDLAHTDPELYVLGAGDREQLDARRIGFGHLSKALDHAGTAASFYNMFSGRSEDGTVEDSATEHLDQRAWRHVKDTFGAGGNLLNIGTTAASLFGRDLADTDPELYVLGARDPEELAARRIGFGHLGKALDHAGTAASFYNMFSGRSEDGTVEDSATEHLDQRAWHHVKDAFGAGGNLLNIGTTAASLFGRDLVDRHPELYVLGARDPEELTAGRIGFGHLG